VMETEWHSASTVGFRMETIPRSHIRAARYLAHIHGMAANMIWFWGRHGWSGQPVISHQFAGANFWQSLPNQPYTMHEYARGAIEANSIGEYLVAMAAAPPQVNMLYSQESLAVDPYHLDR